MSVLFSVQHYMLENLNKPVILTGSQLPIGDLRTDAKENLITSIQIAALTEKGKPVVRDHPLCQGKSNLFNHTCKLFDMKEINIGKHREHGLS